MDYRSETYIYRRAADSVFVARYDLFNARPEAVSDTFFVRERGLISNTVGVGLICQYDPSCVPGGEYADVVFQYRRIGG